MAQIRLDKSAPLWMQRATAILLILQAAKAPLIDGFPGIEDATKTIAGLWFDYIGNLTSVVFGVLTIIIGTENKNPLVKTILLLLGVIFLTGCYTPMKATKQLVKAQAVHPAVVREACATFYPGTDSTHIQEVFIAGDTLVFTDTLQQFHTDTVNNISYRYITKTLTVHDTLTTTRYEQIKNRAHEMHLEAKVATMQETITKTTAGRNAWRIVALVASGLIGVWVVKKIWF